MRLHSEEDDANGVTVDLTPLIDMVFILLLFFIVTSSFVKESGIEVNRPSARSAERQEKGNIIIAVSKNGEIWIDRRKVDMNALRANVERLHAENPEGAVIIAADQESQTGLVIRALDQVRLAGVANVSIAAQTE